MGAGVEHKRVSVSVVVPAYNAASTLPIQLAALAAQDFAGRFEVVVADNGSTDGTADVVEQWRAHIAGLRCVPVSEPGANRARNAGVRASAGDQILLCDADDEVSRGWVRAMNAALERDDVVGGPIEYERLSPASVPRPVAHGTTELPSLFGWRYAISANVGFRREAFDAVEGFDETFGVGGDDVDFSWRVQQAGLSLAFVPEAVVHYRLRTPIRAFFRQQYSYAQGDAHLYAKHRASGFLPERPPRRQLWALAGDVREILRLLPRFGHPPARWMISQESARLAGRLVGAVRWGVYPP